MVLRNGVLVGFVPQIPDSDDLDAAQIADIIAATDYDAPVATKKSTAASAPSAAASPPPGAPSAPAAGTAPPSRPGWRDRLRRRG
jgi:hypothetical protein